MANREKILKGFECCHITGSCHFCPYWNDNTCITDLNADAMKLLQEQQKPKAAHWAKMKGAMPPEFTGHFECDNCGWHGKPFVREIDFAYCPGCGAKMSIDGLHAEDCKKTPFDRMIDDYLEATGGVVNV